MIKLLQIIIVQTTLPPKKTYLYLRKILLTGAFSPGNQKLFNFSHSLFSLFESRYYVYPMYTSIANGTVKQLQLICKFLTFNW